MSTFSGEARHGNLTAQKRQASSLSPYAWLGLLMLLCLMPHSGLWAGENQQPVPDADLRKSSTAQLKDLRARINKELKRRDLEASQPATSAKKEAEETTAKETKKSSWGDWMKVITGDKEGDQSAAERVAEAVLSTKEIREGLREALTKGVRSAIASLGQDDGYFKAEDVKILLPEKFAKMEDTMRFFGQGGRIDDFVKTMNRAAEKAAPATGDIFAKAISQLTIAEAKEILNGKEDEATRYFRKTSTQDLVTSIKPIVTQMTEKAGTSKAYKNLLAKLGPLENVLKSKTFDLDQYVTEKALEGIFLRVAVEEKKIRENPAARTTDILRKVFGKK